jgi:glyoxylase-like metal-dependent hydrolase (beta-lactamase superfamily II)
MSEKDIFPEITSYLAERGVFLVTDIREEAKGSAIANTFFFTADNRNYMVDPACGKKRLSRIKELLPFQEYDVLVTHSHLDHSANSGAAAAKNSSVIFHPLVAGRINNLKRNYTEVTAEMVKTFGVNGFFGRTGILKPSRIKSLSSLQKHASHTFNLLLYLMSLISCRTNIGGIHPPKKKALFLKKNEIQDLRFGKTVFRGWPLSENLFALDTPGHQDDHLAFYLPNRRIMFAGDLINFLNPNDILDGSIKDTHEGMMKMLQLAEAGGIEVLAVSHALPLIGKDNVITYLRSVIAKQDETLDTVSAIVAACPDKTDFETIITRIYAHDSDLMKRILKINYPRSVSFIDVYAYLYLKEFLSLDLASR